MHSSQLFRNLAISGQRALDFLVVVDPVGKERFGDVEIDPQTDRYDARQQQDLSEKVEKPIFSKSATHHYQHSQHNHETEEHLWQIIQLLVSLTHLLPRLVSIHHAAHLSSRIYHYPHRLTIGQEAIPPKSIFQVESLPHAVVLRAGLDLEHSLKVVDIELGRFGLDSGKQADEVAPVAIVLQILVGKVDRLTQLPVSLAVQLVRPNEDCPVLLVSAQYDQVGRNALVWFDLDHLPHLQVPTQNLPSPRLFDQSVDLVIGLLIPLLAVVVIVSLLEQRKSKDQQEGGDVSEEESNLEHADELAEGDDQEEEVEKVPKLVVQHQRQERHPRVLAIVNHVRLSYAQRVDIAVQINHTLLRHRPRPTE